MVRDLREQGGLPRDSSCAGRGEQLGRGLGPLGGGESGTGYWRRGWGGEYSSRSPLMAKQSEPGEQAGRLISYSVWATSSGGPLLDSGDREM